MLEKVQRTEPRPTFPGSTCSGFSRPTEEGLRYRGPMWTHLQTPRTRHEPTDPGPTPWHEIITSANWWKRVPETCPRKSDRPVVQHTVIEGRDWRFLFLRYELFCGAAGIDLRTELRRYESQPGSALVTESSSFLACLSLSLPINDDDLCGMSGAISNLDGGLMMEHQYRAPGYTSR